MDLFYDLPAWAKQKLTEAEGHKEWRRCAYCHARATGTPFKACARCARTPQPVFYCGRKCQKDDWRSHKEDCRHSLVYNPSKYNDYKAMKQITRWVTVHGYILTFCILELFHFNPHLDVNQHFVRFELDPRTMQIVTISANSMVNDPGYFSSPEVQTSLMNEEAFYEVILLGSALNFTGRRGATMRASPLEQLKSSGNRDSIGGYEDWPYIASYLTKKWQPSEIVARRKLSLLIHCTNVLRITQGDTLQEFKAPASNLAPFSLPIDSRVMERWCTKLMPYDVWPSFVGSGVLSELLETSRL